MIRSHIESRIKCLVLVLLSGSLFVAVACRKSPSPPGKQQNVAGKQAEQAKPSAQKQEKAPPASPQGGTTAAPFKKGEPNAPAAKPKESTEPNHPSAGVKAGVEMAPLEILLPKAQFVGTPQPAAVPNLEKPTGKVREPFLVPVGTRNVAFGKKVTSSDEMPIIGELEYITDGDKEASEGSYVELGPGLQHVTIDLAAKHEIYAVVVWHYHKQGHVYFDVVIQVADDPDFITNVKTIFNNDIDNSAGFGVGKDKHYVETNEGKLIDAKGVHGRYVRLCSKGNHVNDMNHYIEVEVYGKPVG